MDLNKTATYPMENDDWVTTTIIGGLLVFFGFLLIPALFVYGYIVRTIRGSLHGESKPPVFSDWGDLLVTGGKAWIISVVYMIVPLIVFAVMIGGSFAAIATGSDSGALLGTTGILIGSVAFGVLSIVFGYFAVVAIVNFAREGSIGAGFDFGTIKTVALDRDFAVAWLVSVGAFFVASLVNAVPLVGWIIAPFAAFYAATIAADLWANGFSQALEAPTDTQQVRKEETAI